MQFERGFRELLAVNQSRTTCFRLWVEFLGRGDGALTLIGAHFMSQLSLQMKGGSDGGKVFLHGVSSSSVAPLRFHTGVKSLTVFSLMHLLVSVTPSVRKLFSVSPPTHDVCSAELWSDPAELGGI